jgi:hypothetical protein
LEFENRSFACNRAVLTKLSTIGVLDARGLSVRAAERTTGVAASEFSRIRNVKLTRFTIDRMIVILGKLSQDVIGQDVELTVKVRSHPKRTPPAQPHQPAPEPAKEPARVSAARTRTPATTAASSHRKRRPRATEYSE